MAFTGDLEHLPIADIIQLVHTTRKSGIFSVRGDKGESRLVFSSGYIVGANHLDDSVRIGTVLVKNGAITIDDLKRALDATKETGQDHRPLVATLMQMGNLTQEDALRGLKKLVEVTIIELMSWTSGTFTFDTEAIVISPKGGEGQDVVVDAQMVLMDALRIFDERERDRARGKEVQSFETLYADVLPGEGSAKTAGASSTITADVLGLADVDKLQKKIPRPAAEMELFDPVEIHRRNIKEILTDFSSAEQEAFVSFLKTPAGRKPAADTASQQPGRKVVVIFSGDMLVRHGLMTICNEEGIPVFATDSEVELERIISQCLSGMRTPSVVFDGPVREQGFTEKKVLSMRTTIIKKYPAVPVLQFASVDDSDFFLQSYSDGVRAVFPKPAKEVRRESYIHDTMQFLGSFRSYIKGALNRVDTTDRYVKELKENIKMLREVNTPSDAAMVVLAGVAEVFERVITFFVRPSELVGERAVGVSADKSVGPIPADRLKIQLSKPSIFRDMLEQGLAYYGESSDEALKGLLQEIGMPRSPAFVLLPVTCDRKVIALVYGDFGQKEASPVQLDILEILAQQVGIVLEYALFRRQINKAAQKT